MNAIASYKHFLVIKIDGKYTWEKSDRYGKMQNVKVIMQSDSKFPLLETAPTSGGVARSSIVLPH